MATLSEHMFNNNSENFTTRILAPSTLEYDANPGNIWDPWGGLIIPDLTKDSVESAEEVVVCSRLSRLSQMCRLPESDSSPFETFFSDFFAANVEILLLIVTLIQQKRTGRRQTLAEGLDRPHSLHLLMLLVPLSHCPRPRLTNITVTLSVRLIAGASTSDDQSI